MCRRPWNETTEIKLDDDIVPGGECDPQRWRIRRTYTLENSLRGEFLKRGDGSFQHPPCQWLFMPGWGAFIRQFEIAFEQFAEALDLRHHRIQYLHGVPQLLLKEFNMLLEFLFAIGHERTSMNLHPNPPTRLSRQADRGLPASALPSGRSRSITIFCMGS